MSPKYWDSILKIFDNKLSTNLARYPPLCDAAQAAEVKLPARFFASLKIQNEEEQQYLNEGPQYPTLHIKLSKLLQILHIDLELETNTWSGKISRGVDKDKAARVFWPGD